MKKFKFLTIHNIKKAIVNKAFLISNVVLLLAVVVLVNLPHIISMFSGGDENIIVDVYYDDVSTENDEKLEKYLTNTLSDDGLVLMGLKDTKFQLTFHSKVPTSEEVASFNDKYKGTKQEVAIYFTNTNDLNSLSADLYYNSVSETSINVLKSVIGQSIVVIDNVSLPVVVINDHHEEVPGGMTEGEIFKMTMINLIISVPMLMIVIRAVMFVGVDIVQEKSSKAIETIISSVPPKTHFISKITASLVFVLAQGALMIVFFLIAALIGAAMGEMPADALGAVSFDIGSIVIYVLVAILFALIMSLIYIVIGGLVAAMSNSQEDYQNAQGPLTMILLLGFYLNMFLVPAGATGMKILRIVSYIPPISGFTAPVAFAGGIIAWWELLISLALMCGLLAIIIYSSGPVYRVSILSYDNSKFFKRIRNSFKKAKLERKNKNDKPRIN